MNPETGVDQGMDTEQTERFIKKGGVNQVVASDGRAEKSSITNHRKGTGWPLRPAVKTVGDATGQDVLPLAYLARVLHQYRTSLRISRPRPSENITFSLHGGLQVDHQTLTINSRPQNAAFPPVRRRRTPASPQISAGSLTCPLRTSDHRFWTQVHCRITFSEFPTMHLNVVKGLDFVPLWNVTRDCTPVSDAGSRFGSCCTVPRAKKRRGNGWPPSTRIR